MRPLGFVLPFALWIATAHPSPPVQLDSRAPAGMQETDHLTLKPSSGRRAAAPGARVSLFLDIAPKPRMHVYAPEQKQYIPVSIALAPDPALKPHPPVFPPAEKYLFKPLNETQLVYSKPFRVVQDVTIADTPDLRRRPTLTIIGTVRYQACDDEICYVPKSVPIAWTVSLGASAIRK